jgi:DNA invertase Pin-like site-specific DNA recombinase
VTAPLVAYSRVSTAGQAESGLGISAQLDAIDQAARLHGFEVSSWHEDAGKSGAKMSNRPGLQAALEEIRSGRAGGLVCAKLDRLGRSAAEVLTLAEQARREGWRLLILDVGADTDGLAGEVVLMALAMAARIEHVRISERQCEKFAQLRKAGRARGRPAVSREVADRIIAARDGGATWEAIARALAAEGVSTARGGSWRPSAVRSAYLTRSRELAAQQ